MGRGQVAGRNGWGRTSGPLGLGHLSPPPERGTLKLAVCRTLGTVRGEGEGRLTFSGLGNPERSVLRALLSQEERGLRCLSARLRGGRWSRDSGAGRAVSAAFGAEKEESSVG